MAVLAFSVPLHAQSGTLTGAVVDADGQPLPGAHVYLAGSMQGTTTLGDGGFSLARVPAGAHRVVASMLGYEVESEEVVLRAGEHRELRFELRPTVVTMAPVDVSAARDRRWQRRLARFEQTLFGQSSFADSVRLLNPEVLDFSHRLGRLTATASAPLEIENRALGYRIRYDLTVFDALPHRVRYDGDPLFEELTPRDTAEARRWADARRRAYRGSLRHLLRSLIEGTAESQRFYLVHRPDEGPGARGASTPTGFPPRRRPVSSNDLVSRSADDENVFELRFRGLLEVVYEGEPEDEQFPSWEWNVEGSAHPRPDQRSEVFLDGGRTLVDHRGELVDPFGMTRRGYLAFRRLAMLLPVEYEGP